MNAGSKTVAGRNFTGLRFGAIRTHVALPIFFAMLTAHGLVAAQSSASTTPTSNVETVSKISTGVREAANWIDDRWYIEPFLMGWDRNRYGNCHCGGQVSFGLALGKSITPDWDVELRGGSGLVIDAKWFALGRGTDRVGEIQPYIVAGVGVGIDTVSRPAGDVSYSSFVADAGIGAVMPVSNWARLVVDLRIRYDANRGHLYGHNGYLNTGPMVSVGLQIPFGSVSEVASPAR
jgi:OOP family OmpA-OmpF porin